MQKVNEPTPIVETMAKDWALIGDLLGGTRAMRLAGIKYLPKRAMEEQKDYDARLSTSTLLPALSETVAKLTGRVFAEPLIVNDDVPPWIRGAEGTGEGGLLDDIDLQGNNIHVFARDVFDTALGYGLTYVLVDAPVKTPEVQTQADESRAKLRPYCIHIKPQRMLGWIQNINGTLVQVRILFTREEPDSGGFGTVSIPQVKVFDVNPGVTKVRIRTFEKVTTEGAANQGQWVQIGGDVMTGLDEIPLVTFYTDRTGFMVAQPPLRELAFLNVKHWVVQSGHDSLLDTASVAILTVIGATLDDIVEIGAKRAIQLPMGADLKYVEHSGKAIEAGANALEKLKADMRDAGAKLLQPGTGKSAPAGGQIKTAAQSTEEAAGENSALGTMVRDSDDGWAQVLYFMAQYRSEKKGGTVTAQPNLDPDMAPVESLTYLLAMANAGKLSDETLFTETQKRGMISEDIEWEKEQARIRNQPTPAGTRLTAVLPPGNKPPANKAA